MADFRVQLLRIEVDAVVVVATTTAAVIIEREEPTELSIRALVR